MTTEEQLNQLTDELSDANWQCDLCNRRLIELRNALMFWKTCALVMTAFCVIITLMK